MHPGLGCGIGTATLVIGGPGGSLAGARRQTKNPPASLPLHVPGRSPRTEEACTEVEADDEIPVLDAHFPDLGISAATEVVHQDIQPTVTTDCVVDQRLRVSLFGQIADGNDSLATGSMDGVCRLFQRRPVDIAQGEAGAFGSETLGNGLTDALAGTCDHGNLVGKAGHGHDPSILTLDRQPQQTACRGLYQTRLQKGRGRKANPTLTCP